VAGASAQGRRRGSENRPLIAASDLHELGRSAGPNYRVDRQVPDSDAVIEGRVMLRDFRSGLSLHATDAQEIATLRFGLTVPPGLNIALLLDGEVDARLGDVRLRIRTTGQAVGRIWYIPKPVEFERRIVRGNRVRKVHVAVPEAWLHQPDDSVADLLRPLANSVTDDGPMVRSWVPSANAVRCAEEILSMERRGGTLTELSEEIAALTILRDALSHWPFLKDDPPGGEGPDGEDLAGGTLKPRDVQRARAARDLILETIGEGLALPEIARRSGMSVSTLQRVFRNCFGVTVMEYLRVRRLERGRMALDHEGVSVGEAARLSGYSSAANFATAFQREFGYPPSQRRR